MGHLDRRRFIQTGAAAALAGAGGMLATPGSSGAVPPTSSSPAPGFYRFRLGDFQITVLGDGHFDLPAETFGANVTAEQRAAYYRSRSLPLDNFRLTASPVVIDTGNGLVLVDAGRGAPGDPPQSTGWLPASLAAAGIAPGAITQVILTHAHSDHIGGLLDPAIDGPRFPNAELVISAPEYALWTASDVLRRVPGWVVDFGLVDLARDSLAALRDRVRTVPMEGEVLSGIRSVSTPGHTPGHIGVLVASGGEQMIMVGDAIVTAHTHFEHPDWQLGVDHDPEQGVRTRRRLLDRIATDRLLVQGFHLPFPGIGYAVREGHAYRWMPAV
jgi:glyoxylase-like metal-dependent hydrolase (beta-lactamase superfamily II)